MANPVLRHPPLNALRAFEAAARHLNFRIAVLPSGNVWAAYRNEILRKQKIDIQPWPERRPCLTHRYIDSVCRASSVILGRLRRSALAAFSEQR